MKKILDGFKKILKEESKRTDVPWFYKGAIENSIDIINGGKVGSGNIKEVAQSNGQIFSDYIKSLGYEGLITFEGGESGNGNHDTYLIFDSEKVEINQEHNINIE